MNNIIKAIVITGVMTTTVLAYGNSPSMKGDCMMKGGMMKGGMMGMMNHDQMMKMHQHMEDMQSLMKNINNEKDTGKHQQMMKHHMQSMQKGMHMMNNSDCIMEKKGGTMPMDMDMEKRMNMMENHMSMMQMMMGQMIEHKLEEAKSEKNRHK